MFIKEIVQQKIKQITEKYVHILKQTDFANEWTDSGLFGAYVQDIYHSDGEIIDHTRIINCKFCNISLS
jgi:hypothetical protein